MNHTNEDPRKVGYKVLFLSCDNRLNSTFAPIPLCYKVSKWTHKPERCGPLCVFSKERDAFRFWLQGSPRFKIYKCSYILSEETRIYTNYQSSGFDLSQLPVGTIFADSVMLLNEVGKSMATRVKPLKPGWYKVKTVDSKRTTKVKVTI